MLCPEVWEFPTSRRSTFYQIGNYDNKAQQTIDKVIKGCAFNKMVSLVLPGCETIPSTIKNITDTGDYYLIRDLKLCDLVRKDFIEAFIKRGRLTGISAQVGIFNSSENVFAISPEGKLTLLICKDFYQIIGLEGRSTEFCNNKKKKDLFEIIIDLRNETFEEQSKLYNRIRSAFASPEIDLFDFRLSWKPTDASVCPSSIAKFFNDCGYKVEQHSIQIKSTIIKNLKLPNQILAQRQIDTDLANAVAEYFASVLLSCNTEINQQINTYTPDIHLSLHNEQSTQALLLHCEGLLSGELISNLIEVTRQSARSKSIMLSVNVDEKAPNARCKGYTISFLNDTKYLLFKT